MQKKLTRSLQVRIKGDLWSVFLCTPKQYPQWYKSSHAVTMYNHHMGCRELYFKRKHLNYSTVVHELTHAYLSYSIMATGRKILFSTAEEYFCQFLERHNSLLHTKANALLKKLKAL